jgi:hypothetical protein
MSTDPKEESTGWKSSINTLVEFPSKFLIASTLIFVNIFQNIAQERKLKEMIKEVNESPRVNL